MLYERCHLPGDPTQTPSRDLPMDLLCGNPPSDANFDDSLKNEIGCFKKIFYVCSSRCKFVVENVFRIVSISFLFFQLFFCKVIVYKLIYRLKFRSSFNFCLVDCNL